MFIFQTQKYGPQAMHEAKKRFYMLRQDKHTSVQQYYESFINTVEVIEHCGGDIGTDRSLVEEMLGGRERSIASEAIMINAEQQAKDKYLACAFILGADKTRYGRLLEDLENSYTQGDDKFPKVMTDAYNLLVNWKQNPMNYMRVVDSAQDGAMFVTDGAETNDSNTGFPGKCWICKQTGHRKNECPMRSNEYKPTESQQQLGDSTTGTQLLLHSTHDGEDGESVYDQYGFMFQLQSVNDFSFQQSGDEDLRRWILLDNQSTVNVFCNPGLVRNVRRAPNPLELKCNAGVVHVDKIADLPGYPDPVWFNSNGIANVLSLSRVSKLFPVMYNNTEGFVIHKADGRKHIFKESPRGLFYLDVMAKHHVQEPPDGTIMVNTVKDNKAKYSVREVERAKLARKIQHMVGNPSTKQYMAIVDGNQLPNCPVNRADIMAAEDIFGQCVGSLKGKTVHKKPNTVDGIAISLPPDVMECCQNITLAFDIMYVNKVTFLVSLSRNIRFGG
jgi:hypothetical protein